MAVNTTRSGIHNRKRRCTYYYSGKIKNYIIASRKNEYNNAAYNKEEKELNQFFDKLSTLILQVITGRKDPLSLFLENDSILKETILSSFQTVEKYFKKIFINRVNLYEVRKKRLKTYSGGMKQRFGIAQALLGEPELIIVDEPTAGLDPEERNRFYNILSELGEEAIVILSTHIVEDVTSLCSDMAIIGGGQVLVHASPRKIIEAVKGKIWAKEIDRNDLDICKEKLAVIATHIEQGRMRIHVLGNTAPDASFEPIIPDMEDAYFAVISGHANLPELFASVEVGQ